MAVPLPPAIRSLLGKNEHPGLQLDKYVDPDPGGGVRRGTQEAQKAAIERVARVPGDGGLLDSLRMRRDAALGGLEATRWDMTTTGPLALHLSRASTLENAGLCLHPLYGFAFIPGSGLKGLARAYAETIWLQAQEHRGAAWAEIEQVFGWAPESDRNKSWRPREAAKHTPEDPAAAGSVVFHDAWPTTWPGLVVDIVNSHHGDYYQGEGNDAPPGDWEAPVPVYFLAVSRGTAFSFALTPRQRGADGPHVELARQWLVGGLFHLGAGGKTNAGYGRLVPAGGSVAALPSGARATLKCGLELVTPAFVAGAMQQDKDCELRPATLRGQLRWWWRTMHAGYLTVARLREIEGLLWGTSSKGGAISLAVEQEGDARPVKLDKAAEQRKHRLQRPPGNKTTQGLSYLAFGMDDTRAGQRCQRHYLPAGARWSLRLLARSAELDGGTPLAAESVLEQAAAALWLLCRFGGVGAKARKGFGSLAMRPEGQDLMARLSSLDAVQACASKLRRACGLADRFDPGQAHSPALGALAGTREYVLPDTLDLWRAIDVLGFSAQAFASSYKHDLAKKALGLPRNIGRPTRGAFTPNLRAVKERHASPVFYHFDLRPDGRHTLRVIAFVAQHLPDAEQSKAFLGRLLQHLDSDLTKRAGDYEPGPAAGGPSQAPRQAGRPRGGPPQGGRGHARRGPDAQRGAPQPPPRPAGVPSTGERVDAILLEERTRKGGWKARHGASGLSGPIQNTAAVPAEKKPGDRVSLQVAFAKEQEIAFLWPN